MRLKLLLNIENFQNHTIYTAEHSDIKDCYREQVIFLQDWVAYTPFAGKLLTHILKILGGIPIEGEESVPKGETVYLEKPPMVVKENTNASLQTSNPFEITRGAREALAKDNNERQFDSQKLDEGEWEGTDEEMLLGATISAETDKAILVVNHGHQKWIPKQYLIIKDLMVDNGKWKNPVDIKVSKGGGWVLKKPWDVYVEMGR